MDGRRAALALSLLGLTGASWPDVDSPPRGQERATADAALVVGQERYARLPDVPSAHRDALAFRTWLEITRGVPPARVEHVDDAPTPILVTLLEDTLERVGPDGVAWIYFAGHGATSSIDGRHALLGRDDAPDDDALTVEVVQELAARSEAGRVVLVLDTSFGGVGRDGHPLEGGLRAVGPDLLDAPDPRVVTWTAARTREVAGVAPELDHGVFTWHVLGALTGWADGVFGATDGQVTLEEAQAWVRRRLAALDRRQTPSEDPRSGPRGWVIGPAVARSPSWDDLDPLAPPPIDPQLAGLGQEDDDDARKAAEQRAEAEEELRAQVQARADEEWARVYAAATTGRPDGLAGLRAFIDRYDAVTFYPTLMNGGPTARGRLEFTWEGGEIVVSASQVAEARRLLAHGGRPTAPLVTAVRVDAATFPLGTPAAQSRRQPDETLHTVTLTRSFEVATTEVSRRLWTTVTGDSQGEGAPNEPVRGVGWTDAIAFCNALSALDGHTPVYTVRGGRVTWDREADGWRLPTEAEWVLAAGPEPDADHLCARANVRDASVPADDGGGGRASCDDGFPGVAPMEAKEPDARGLRSMYGNVAEWTWDAYAPFDGAAVTDPAVEGASRTRVVKGGSFRVATVRAQAREAVGTGTHRDDVGLRVVRTLPR